MKVNRLNKLKKFLKENFKKGIQEFDTRNTAGDNIEEDIKNAEHFINSIKTDKEYKEGNGWHGYYNKEIVELARMLEHILSDYKKLQEDFEQIDHECNRLEEKEFKLENKINKLKDEMQKDKMEQFDDYVIYLIEKYLKILEK